MIITISGTPGSGKSTLAKMLAEKIGMKRYYMGELFRRLAQQKGMSLRELLELGEKESWVDAEIDQYQKELGEKEDNFIIEGRTSFIMIPHSLKLFITVDPKVGAQRIFNDLQKPNNNRNEDVNLRTLDDVLASNQKRMATDTKRYHLYYHTSVFDPSNYDFVLDTTGKTIPECFEELYQFVSDRAAASV